MTGPLWAEAADNVLGICGFDNRFAGALASREENDDPIDLAVLAGLSSPKDLDPYTVPHFEPFDAVHKRTEATVTAAGKKAASFKVSKGAPQVILELVSNGKKVKTAVDDTARTRRGRRHGPDDPVPAGPSRSLLEEDRPRSVTSASR